VVVRRNALKHGLAAQVVVGFGEDAEAFRVMADAHLAAFRPRNDVEFALVNTFSVAAWVRRQCVSAETCMTNQYIRQGLAEAELTSAEAAERIPRLAFDPRKEADKVRRYEDASIRRMSRACSDFIKLRESAILDVVADPELEFAIRPDAAKCEVAPVTGSDDSKNEPESDAAIGEGGSPLELPAWNPTSGLPRFAFDCFSFKRRPRNSDRCVAKYPRRTKPRQSVRVARAPPSA